MNESRKQVDVRDVYRRLGRELPQTASNGWVTVRCLDPKHPDEHPSCSVNVETGWWQCRACSSRGNLTEAVKVALNYSDEQVLEWLTVNGPIEKPTVSLAVSAQGEKSPAVTKSDPKKRPASDEVPWDDVAICLEIAQDRVRTDPATDAWFRENVGISQATAIRFGLGFGKGQPDHCFRDERVWIPVHDADGKLLAVRGYKPKAKEYKILPVYSGMRTSLFPLNQLPQGTKSIVLVEGERDCLVMYEHGLVVVTGTGGAGTFKREWAEWLLALGIEHVIVLYDFDDPGREGAQRAASILAASGIKVSIASWPEGSPSGFDAADWFASGKTAEQLQTEVLDKAIAFEPEITYEEDDEVVNVGEFTIVVIRNRRPFTVRTAMLANVLAGTQRFFRRGTDIWVADLEEAFAINNADQFGGALDGYVEFARRVKSDKSVDEKGDPIPEFVFQSPPYDLFRRLKHAPAQRARLPVLNHYSRIPIFDGAFNLIEPRYHPATGFYYAGPKVTPASDRSHLDVICEEFAWRDPATDRANFFGMLLTAVLMPQFIGKHPAIVINGNQRSVGKTLMATIISILVDGRPPHPITYTADGAEFEKQLATRVNHGDNVILIDNIDVTVVKSAALDRSVTGTMLNFRRLGTNEEISMPNTALFVLTLNNSGLSKDLATRCIPIHLYFEGPAEQRKFKRSNLDGYVLEHRRAILEELVGMVVPWRAAGCPMAEIRPTRFGDWSQIVGSILAFNGIDGFVANWDESALMMSDDTDEIVKLVLAIHTMNRHNQWLEAREIVDMAGAFDLFPTIASRGPKGAAVAMSRHLGAFKDRVLPIDEGVSAVLRIENDATTNKKRYRFDIDGELSQGAKIERWPITSGSPNGQSLRVPHEEESTGPVRKPLNMHRIAI